MFYSQTYCALL
jgi:hypothetical protein